jgi:hypothetical protein
MKGSADAFFDLIDGLIVRPIQPGWLHDYFVALNLNTPAVLVKVGDEEADRAQLQAVAVVYIATCQRPEFGDEGGRCVGRDGQCGMKPLTLARC